KEFEVLISKKSMKFMQRSKLLFTATVDDNCGYLDGHTIDTFENVHSASTLPLDVALWHQQLGHYNYDGIKQMLKDNLVVGLTMNSKTKPDPICEPCLAGKMSANPFPSSDRQSNRLLQLIHSDVKHVGIPSHSGYKYWVTFITDKGRFKCVIPLKLKSDTFAAFKQYKAWAENQTGEKIGALQCDGDGEYIGNEFRHFLTEFGIELCMSTRNHPQQNGVAERANRILGDAVVAMLTESGLSKKFWCEAVAAYVHVWNRVPTLAVPNTTPFEVWYRKKPDVRHLRVWGCVAYVHIQRDKQDKLGSHMEKCIFIGYPDGIKGWKFYNPTTHKVVISKRADFDERYTYKSFGTTLVDIPD